MKLYGSIASPYVARVVMFAKLKGVDLPLEEAPGGGIKSPEFLKLNPIGKMPALDVDGKGIGESTVICDYLEDVYPKQSGLPADPLERARSRLVGRITDLYLAAQVGPLFRHMNPAKRDAAAVEAAGKEIVKVCGYLEQVMGAGPFCVGATPTFGDCALGPTIAMTRKIITAGQFDIPDPVAGGRLATWWKAMEKHAVCAEVLNAYGTAFDGFMKMMAARR